MGDEIYPDLIYALRTARRIAVLTGAGVSAESGIQTFREALTGLWENFDAHELATADAFVRDPALVWGWYEWRRSRALAAQPNPAHLAIADLARLVPQLSLFTQNVDDLHERAGSADVQHLHGSLNRPRCFECGYPYSLTNVIVDEPKDAGRLSPPSCKKCGWMIRPGVVWFNEQLPTEILNNAFEAASSCDLFIVIGTSGVVYPAAELPALASRAGGNVIQINLAKSALDHVCTWNLRGAAGEVLPNLVKLAF